MTVYTVKGYWGTERFRAESWRMAVGDGLFFYDYHDGRRELVAFYASTEWDRFYVNDQLVLSEMPS